MGGGTFLFSWIRVCNTAIMQPSGLTCGAAYYALMRTTELPCYLIFQVFSSFRLWSKCEAWKKSLETEFLWFRRRCHRGSEGEVWRGGGAAPAPLSCTLAALRPSSGTGSKQASPPVSSLQFYIFSLCCIAGPTVFYSNLKAAFRIRKVLLRVWIRG